MDEGTGAIMISNTINIGAIEGVQRALDKLSESLRTKFAQRATYDVADAIQGVILLYPGPSNQPVKWPSEKARRYYFAMRRKRGLPMEYARGSDPMSQRMQQSWTIRKGRDSATLGNRATYAPYVASSELQTEQHKLTGFVTDKQAIDRVTREGTMQRIVQAELRKVMREAFRGLG